MEKLTKSDLLKIISDLKQKAYLTQSDRQTFLKANKLIINL